MGIQHITVAEVSCQNCEDTILVKNWRDANEYGWAVPIDGHFQLCPACLKDYKAKLFEKIPE